MPHRSAGNHSKTNQPPLCGSKPAIQIMVAWLSLSLVMKTAL
ncbi:MAG: hypothetical protein ACI8W8_004282, partial [Rhodothermales bacterium]